MAFHFTLVCQGSVWNKEVKQRDKGQRVLTIVWLRCSGDSVLCDLQMIQREVMSSYVQENTKGQKNLWKVLFKDRGHTQQN